MVGVAQIFVRMGEVYGLKEGGGDHTLLTYLYILIYLQVIISLSILQALVGVANWLKKFILTEKKVTS